MIRDDVDCVLIVVVTMRLWPEKRANSFLFSLLFKLLVPYSLPSIMFSCFSRATNERGAIPILQTILQGVYKHLAFYKPTPTVITESTFSNSASTIG